MKKIFSASFYFLLIGIVFFTSCKLQKETAAASLSKVSSNTLLWKIEGKDIQPSFIYGTIHLISQTDYFMAEATTTAFNECEQTVLEVDMDDPNIQMEMMKGAIMKDGMTLDKLLSEADYKKVDESMKAAMGAGIGMFNAWQPMMLSSFFLPQFVEGPPASYEASFTKMAKDANKEIFGLETVKDQMEAISAIELKDQVDMLMEVVNDLDAAKKLFQDLVDVYKKQDINLLHKFIVEQSGGELMAQKLLDGRNKNWIPKIGTFSKEKKTFYAVGSGHLGGEVGVINLLRKAGYTVTPIPNTK